MASSGLSINDVIVIRALYDRRLHPGMGRAAALRQVRRLVPALALGAALFGEMALYQ